MLHPAWLKAGITSRRKLTRAGCSIARTVTVVLDSRLPLRATIVALPLPVGITRPLEVTEATAGFELTHSTERVWSSTVPSAFLAVATSWAVARRPISVGLCGKIESCPFALPGSFVSPARARPAKETAGTHPNIAARTVATTDRGRRVHMISRSERFGGDFGRANRGKPTRLEVSRPAVGARHPEKEGNWRREIHTLNNIPTVAEFSRKVKQFLVRVADHDRRSCSRYSIRYLSNAKDTPNARES